MLSFSTYQDIINRELQQLFKNKQPQTMYRPISYTLNLKGKRIRSAICLMITQMYGSHYTKALNAALAIEVFHNFSLVHDDIMDAAPLRRGEATVYKKWGVNTAILCGDAMQIIAYQLFEKYEVKIQIPLTKLFNKTALAVCEGQQYDIDFETSTKVGITDYLKMIANKTAVLLAAAMKMGGIIASAESEQVEKIYQFGLNLGIAFQLKDDYLDAFGNPKSFGKQLGGDIIENKKTFLYLKAYEMSNDSQRKKLEAFYGQPTKNPAEKVSLVKQLFEETAATKATLIAIENYTQKAFEMIPQLAIEQKHKETLEKFGNWLLNRSV